MDWPVLVLKVKCGEILTTMEHTLGSGDTWDYIISYEVENHLEELVSSTDYLIENEIEVEIDEIKFTDYPIEEIFKTDISDEEGYVNELINYFEIAEEVPEYFFDQWKSYCIYHRELVEHSEVEEKYQGVFYTMEKFAEYIAEELYPEIVNSHLGRFIDYEWFGQDLEQEYTIINGHVFRD